MRELKSVAIITGGSSGIGFEVALRYAQSGYNVVIMSSNIDKLDGAVKKLMQYSENIFKYCVDVSDKKKVDIAIKNVYERFSRIDVLVNSAGIMPVSFIKEDKVGQWEKTIDINLKGTINTTTEVLKYMKIRDSGHIVNIGSIFAYKAEPYGVMYSVSKHGVKAFTEGLIKELELEKRKIYVSLINPGPVKTNLTEQHKIKIDMLSASSVADVIFKITTDISFRNISEVKIIP